MNSDTIGVLIGVGVITALTIGEVVYDTIMDKRDANAREKQRVEEQKARKDAESAQERRIEKELNVKFRDLNKKQKILAELYLSRKDKKDYYGAIEALDHLKETGLNIQ